MNRRQLQYADVLVVAPDEPGLNAVPEVDTISELGYSVRVLQGLVDDERLYRAVQDRKYDVLHFSCHGDLDALGVSGGRLGRNAVLQVARMSGARLAFLNACSSVQLGTMLVNEGFPMVIASIVPVADDIARQTSQAFYTLLAQSGDLTLAYKAACAGGDVLYTMLSNGGYAALQARPVLERLEALQAAMGESDEDRRRMHREIGRLGWIVAGSAGMSGLSALALLLHWMAR